MDGLIHAILVGVLFTIMAGIFFAITRAADKAINKRKINTTNELANDTMKADDLSSTTKEEKEEVYAEKKKGVNKWNSLLTEKEKESSDELRKCLVIIGAYGVLKYKKEQGIPIGIDKFKEELITSTGENAVKEIQEFPNIIYTHACNRLNIKPWEQEDMITNGLYENTMKILDHAPIINSLKDTLIHFVGEKSRIALSEDGEKQIDEIFYELIENTVEALKKIE